jgi:thiamine biosynthesis lipoprotein
MKESGARACSAQAAIPFQRAVHRWLALAAAAVLAACGQGQDPVIELSGPTMGTYYSVKVARPPAGVTRERLQTGVDTVLQDVNRLISTYDPSSELSRFNQNPATDWVAVPPELLGVIAEGLDISKLSDGAFDITVGPLVNLWGFGPDPVPDDTPSDQEIRNAMARVGHGLLGLRKDPPAIAKKRGDLYVDLSALGEGYGADRVADYLDALGISDFMVAVAGAIRAKGRNAEGSPWAIAIEEPTPGRRAVQRIIHITGEGLSTSGDYRNYFERDGKRYSHEIDPRTGRPIEHRLASVTVIGETAARADGLATALMVMGETDGPALAEAEDIAALFIVRTDQGFREVASAAFAPYLAE